MWFSLFEPNKSPAVVFRIQPRSWSPLHTFFEELVQGTGTFVSLWPYSGVDHSIAFVGNISVPGTFQQSIITAFMHLFWQVPQAMLNKYSNCIVSLGPSLAFKPQSLQSEIHLHYYSVNTEQSRFHALHFTGAACLHRALIENCLLISQLFGEGINL